MSGQERILRNEILIVCWPDRYISIHGSFHDMSDAAATNGSRPVASVCTFRCARELRQGQLSPKRQRADCVVAVLGFGASSCRSKLPVVLPIFKMG